MDRQTYKISLCFNAHVVQLERPEERCAVKKAGTSWEQSFGFQPGVTLVPPSRAFPALNTHMVRQI